MDCLTVCCQIEALLIASVGARYSVAMQQEVMMTDEMPQPFLLLALARIQHSVIVFMSGMLASTVWLFVQRPQTAVNRGSKTHTYISLYVVCMFH